MAKTNGIIADFEALEKAESVITEKLHALDAEADALRVQRNQAVIAWLQKYGTPAIDRKGRKVYRAKPFGHGGALVTVLMAYQKSDEQGVKPNAYIQRVSVAPLAERA